MHEINSNAYVINLLPDFGISSSFNIELLVRYKGRPIIPGNPLVDPDEPPIDLDTEIPLLAPLCDIIPDYRQSKLLT